MSGLSWAWSRARTGGWFVDDRPRARIVDQRGAVIAELPGAATRLVEFDDELLAIGEDRVWLCSLRDTTITERSKPATLAADAAIVGVGGRRLAWVGPGDHAVKIFDLDTEVGLQLWPLEGRVSHHRPRLAVADDRRSLVWCHVAASVDRFDLVDGGYPRSLAQPPAPDGPVSAAVFPAESVELLVVLDDGDVGLARGVEAGLSIEVLAGEGDRAPTRWTIPGSARPLDLVRDRALVLGDRGIELWSTCPGRAACLLGCDEAEAAVSGRLLADGRALLGDAGGRAWIASLEDPCARS